jgi:hypothetical protein
MAPRWLTEGEGEPLGYSLDLMKDAMAERLRLSLLARFPSLTPDDALDAIGRDRRVPRGLNETRDKYVARLLRWLDDRKLAGTAFALSERLTELLGPLPRIRIVNNNGKWHTRDVDGAHTDYIGNNWNWDGNVNAWSRFWVIIYPNGLWSPLGSWGASGVASWGAASSAWGCTISKNEVSLMRAVIDDWKTEGTICQNIILAFDPVSFSPFAPEPDGNWGNWSKNVGGVQVPSRLATARYLDGV